MILKGTLRSRISWPTGSESGNRLSATVWPRTATLRMARSSFAEKKEPDSTFQSRMSW